MYSASPCFSTSEIYNLINYLCTVQCERLYLVICTFISMHKHNNDNKVVFSRYSIIILIHKQAYGLRWPSAVDYSRPMSFCLENGRPACRPI